MIRYGRRSRENIAQLCGPLQVVLYAYADEAPEDMDLTITVGHRGQAEQHRAFVEGNSKLDWPDSPHNKKPSRAFDFVPCPFDGKKDWRDSLRFARIAGGLLYVARQKKVRLRWGGDWDQDGRSNDQTFLDLGHLEVI